MIQFLFLQFLQVYFLFYAKYTILCICLFDNLHAPLSPPARIIPGILISESLCTGFYRIRSGGSIDSRPGGKQAQGLAKVQEIG